MLNSQANAIMSVTEVKYAQGGMEQITTRRYMIIWQMRIIQQQGE